MTSPLNENSGGCPATGRNSSTTVAAHNETMGPSLKRSVVLVLYTDPFLKSLIRV